MEQFLSFKNNKFFGEFQIYIRNVPSFLRIACLSLNQNLNLSMRKGK